MTAKVTPHGRHRISRAVAEVRATLGAVGELPLWSMQAPEAAETLTEIAKLESQVAALKLRVARHAQTQKVEAASGATSTAAWLAVATRATRRETARTMRLAEQLDTMPTVAQALGRGELLLEQAEVIARAIDKLPDDTDPQIREQAQVKLVELAQQHDAKDLIVLGNRILDIVCPEVGEAAEAAALAREEREAEKACKLTMLDDGEGRTHGRFVIPTMHAEALKKALFAHAALTHEKVTSQSLGQAFCDYILRYPADALPQRGGVNATVVVTIPLAVLEGRLAACELDTGTRISPGAARRLACEAGLIPAVLDARSQVLDLGRTRRLFTTPQRIALGLQQKTCRSEGCDRPASTCEAHHKTRWTDGGRTDLRDGVLLCPSHHQRAHDPTYRTTYLPTGTVRFHRRT
ncbi:HNH endonuclease signature motif containing protein [Nocardioides sp. SYSU D00038]|uniref:HNH endonuclease signature motif containing protein n=1 Tax=Nocardioides sp. SYSU D00038 TaxID=2812554 RepID=UPI001968880F|nr:HNH endonuclease signature motif containing protein [Nocardioides sp. SYSU D00038]